MGNRVADYLAVLLKMLCTVVMCVVLGGAIMTCVFLIPSDRLIANVRNCQGIYTDNPIEAWNNDYWNYTQTDMQMESIKIMEAISNEDGGAFSRAMSCVYYTYEDSDKMQSLVRYVNGEAVQNRKYYARYWHGYLIYLKPLLYMLDLSTIKLINMSLQFVICIIVTVLINNKLGTMYVFAFAGAVLVLNPVKIFLSMQNDIIFYITSIALMIMLIYNAKMKRRSYVYFFLLIGVSVAFLDLLTYPVVSVSIPLIVYILLNKGDIKDYFRSIIVFSVSWTFGYAGMWMGKWFLSDLFLNTDVINDGFYNLIYRVSGDPYTEVGGTDSSFVHTVMKNWNVLDVLPLKIFILIMIIVAGCFFLKKRGKIDFDKIIAILIVSLYPFGWYYVVRNHSVIHPWFEYQELAALVFGILCILGIMCGNYGNENKVIHAEG